MPFGVLSEPSKEGPKSLSFNPPVELISGTRNFHHFFHFLNKNIRMLWRAPEHHWDTSVLRKSHWLRGQEIPFQGGDMPRGSKLVVRSKAYLYCVSRWNFRIQDGFTCISLHNHWVFYRKPLYSSWFRDFLKNPSRHTENTGFASHSSIAAELF